MASKGKPIGNRNGTICGIFARLPRAPGFHSLPRMSPNASAIPRRCLLAAPLLLLMSPAAQAHAIIRRSEPAAGARVPAGPVRLRLLFNSRLDHERSALLIAPARLGGGGTADEIRVPLAPDSPPAELIGTTQPLTPGQWRIRWQVLALDGHITRGDIPFTVAA